jgi:putative membrane-bound dehydrogenase-like protein
MYLATLLFEFKMTVWLNNAKNSRPAVTRFIFLLSVTLICLGCGRQASDQSNYADTTVLRIEHDVSAGTLSVFREGRKLPIVTQNAREDFRPYLHPIVAPDGKGVLTEYSPGHHKHQTGLYWGFTRVNGRDYFHHPEGDYWKRISAKVIQGEGKVVQWQTVYDLLAEDGSTVLTETQTWSLTEVQGKYFLDLEWKGEAKTDITIGEYDYGGLFLRMPWKEGIQGEVINAARQRNEKAEGQRAMWVDVGMQVKGRDDLAHVAIFDHIDNERFPQPWRVDGQLGVGPALARLGDWKIAKGKTETLRHRLVVYSGVLNDVDMIKAWETYVGDSTYSTASLWDLARAEGRAAKFLTPSEAVESMTLPEGFKANVWAAEPMMTQPMAFCWDDRGRLWIAENKDYESRGDGFSNSGKSRILILEDTDRDGVADSRKVFLEGIAFPAAIAIGFDGLFLGAPPNLIFVPDRNKDDEADMNDLEIRLTGWGIRDRHETLNSLHWGPDGWLYGCQGFATPSKIKIAKGKGRVYKHNDPFPKDILEGEGVEINGGVWRYHPVKDKFEVVAHGFSNPWGIDYDAKGQMFISACVIPHLWHVIPGGLYHRQGGQHFNPYVYNDIKTIADHRHRSAHGGLRIYLSDAFPASQHGRLFMANIHEHGVLSDVVERKGSGFTARHGEDFAMANNAQWVGFSMEVGPDGALYVLDWHDGDICGGDVLNEETGRIFRISPEKSLAENFEGRYGDLSKMTDAQLVELQKSKSNWHASRARIILQARAAKGQLQRDTHERLREIFQKNTDGDLRLRAMWSLYVTAGFNEAQLLNALGDEDEYVRAWAVQMICEEKAPSGSVLEELNRTAGKEQSPTVRLYLASALQRMDLDDRWSIATALVSRAEDAQDHNLPKMIWYGIEPLVPDNADRAFALATGSKIPMITRYIARRSVDADVIEPLIANIGKKEGSTTLLLEGMLDGIEGRKDIPTPKNWEGVYASLRSSKDAEVRQLALAIAQQFGDAEAAREFLTTVQDNGSSIEQRVKALKALAGKQRVELLRELPRLYDDPGLRIEAIRATAEYDREELGKLLIEKYPQFNAAEKLETIQTLASRPGYGWLLTRALRSKVIPKADVPVYTARQLLRVVGSGFLEVWGQPLDELSNDQRVAFDKYKNLLTYGAIADADAVKGRVIFSRTCGPCHKMYNEGGTLGPDITGSNRANLDYLLSNVLNPSGEIQDDYKMVVVTSRDGRTFVGNVVAENERQITLRVVGQDAIVINKSDIQSRETTDTSMMPQGLFNSLTDAEVLDLVAYLRTSTQVRLPSAQSSLP